MEENLSMVRMSLEVVENIAGRGPVFCQKIKDVKFGVVG